MAEAWSGLWWVGPGLLEPLPHKLPQDGPRHVVGAELLLVE